MILKNLDALFAYLKHYDKFWRFSLYFFSQELGESVFNQIIQPFNSYQIPINTNQPYSFMIHTTLTISHFVSLFQGLEETGIRTLFRKLAHIHHPDKGGDNQSMSNLIEAYKHCLKANNPETNIEIEKDLLDKLDQIMKLNGIEIELIGTWIWVTGNTKESKEELKANNFRFSPKKVAWYYRQETGTKKNYRGQSSLEEIRNKYGSVLKNKTQAHKFALS